MLNITKNNVRFSPIKSQNFFIYDGFITGFGFYDSIESALTKEDDMLITYFSVEA